ncbi:MAG: hypothetical protein KGO81_06050 [Bacteroidota bacterium]|nr:hypothetical protein [Bacteroidota bacterium]
MQTITQGFNIEDEHIKWGTLLKDAKDILRKFSQYPQYENRGEVCCKCTEIFGLKSTVANLSAPLEERPVMQVSYELVPSRETRWGKLHLFYVDQLIKTLGQPTKTESLYNDCYGNLNKEYISGSVVYSANWLIGDIRISLSVYGGIRHEKTGDAAAGLFIDWINEKKAAEPFRYRNIILEQELYAYLGNSSAINKYVLAENQRKFYVTHIGIGDPDVTNDESLRVAQMALYRKELLQTPNFLRHSLKENEIVIKFLTEERLMIIANKWDATILRYSQNETVNFLDVLPARGPGEYFLQVKDLSIIDSRKNDTLLNLVTHIESITGLKVNRETGYDD